jgi:tRNA (cytidine/uridine-2'-O-)-methyltransferase
MFHIALYQPEIPPNTGNIMRLCANAGFTLHLIKPLAFDLDEKSLRRAGLDYRDWANVLSHENVKDFLNAMQGRRIFACSTKGNCNYAEINYEQDDVLLFGPETRGLPEDLRNNAPINEVIKIPMQADSRSLNLANAVAIIAYEAWRQHGFIGSA